MILNYLNKEINFCIVLRDKVIKLSLPMFHTAILAQINFTVEELQCFPC